MGLVVPRRNKRGERRGGEGEGRTEYSRLSSVSKARYYSQFDLWISLSNRHRCGILRSIRAPAGSSFLRTLSSRTYRKNLFVYPTWRTAVSYVHAYAEYSGIHGARLKEMKTEETHTRTYDVLRIALIFTKL